MGVSLFNYLSVGFSEGTVRDPTRLRPTIDILITRYMAEKRALRRKLARVVPRFPGLSVSPRTGENLAPQTL